LDDHSRGESEQSNDDKLRLPLPMKIGVAAYESWNTAITHGVSPFAPPHDFFFFGVGMRRCL
jgi:hypothetical protein